VKPYFEHNGIVIYHGDCREVLPTLRDDSADLILTDPLYGVDFQSSWRQDTFDKLKGDESLKVAHQVAVHGLNAAIKVLRYSRHLYIFGRFDLSDLPLTPAVELIWDKQYVGMGDLSQPWGSQHEYIQFCVSRKRRGDYGNAGSLAARLRKGTVLSYPRKDGSVILHPNEKPVALLRELIESSSRIGETVLDPFMGSGSTLKACELEGRKAIGIEIEEKYCEIAANRLEKQETLQFERAGDAQGEGRK
jgi:site-specific DNA-methyltransferase (adenine-specific)